MNHWSLSALGMGTVFLALIGLALIVSLFPLVFRKPERKVKDVAPLPSITSTTAPVGAPVAAAASAQSVAGGQEELVAILTAAVAAASGMSASQFRITQVVQAQGAGGFNTPAWGYADRLVRTAHVR